MRQRPHVSVWLTPPVVHPGDPLRVDLRLTSRADTPFHSMVTTLRGLERFTTVGEPALAHVALETRHPGGVLTRGAHAFSSQFAIPPGAPPTHDGRIAVVSYELEVWVTIPWWPDLRRTYAVPVVARPASRPERAAPQLYCSSLAGPQPNRLYLEAAIDSGEIAPGGVLSGAVSVHNVSSARVAAIDLHFVATERAPGRPWLTPVESRRYHVRVHTGAPREGESMKFAVRLPRDAPVSLRTARFEVHWRVDVTAVVSLGDDVGLRIPVDVVPAPLEPKPATSERARMVAPVGRERRARLWSAMAALHGCEFDAEAERLHRMVGNVAVSIALDARAQRGTYTVATLTWPALGLDVLVRDAAWGDALSPAEINVGDEAFDKQFGVRGREEAQIIALLGQDVRTALLRFAEVHLDDHGATLALPGAGQTEQPLDDAVRRALSAAAALDAAFRQVQPPRAMAPHADAWRAYAARLSGRYEPGRVWIHEGAYGTERVALGTRWSRRGKPEATVVRVAAPQHAAAPRATAGDITAHLPATARALWTSLAADVPSLTLEDDALTVELPAPHADPATLVGLLDQLARLARALRGGADAGPFR